jgi:hypothetical protein
METYDQGGTNNKNSGFNCLDCHNSVNADGTTVNPNIFTTGVSHVFGRLKPLF